MNVSTARHSKKLSMSFGYASSTSCATFASNSCKFVGLLQTTLQLWSVYLLQLRLSIVHFQSLDQLIIVFLFFWTECLQDVRCISVNCHHKCCGFVICGPLICPSGCLKLLEVVRPRCFFIVCIYNFWPQCCHLPLPGGMWKLDFTVFNTYWHAFFISMAQLSSSRDSLVVNRTDFWWSSSDIFFTSSYHPMSSFFTSYTCISISSTWVVMESSTDYIPDLISSFNCPLTGSHFFLIHVILCFILVSIAANTSILATFFSCWLHIITGTKHLWNTRINYNMPCIKHPTFDNNCYRN